MNQGFWRKWHRWIGIVAAPFLLYAAITGICLMKMRRPGLTGIRRFFWIVPIAIPIATLLNESIL